MESIRLKGNIWYVAVSEEQKELILKQCRANLLFDIKGIEAKISKHNILYLGEPNKVNKYYVIDWVEYINEDGIVGYRNYSNKTDKKTKLNQEESFLTAWMATKTKDLCCVLMIPKKINCNLCGEEMQIKSTRKFTYSSGVYNRFMGHGNFRQCNGIVGLHPDGTILSYPCDSKTKAARKAVHDLIDPLWKEGKVNRKKVYQHLASALGISKEQCHIGYFDYNECIKATRTIKQKIKSWK